MKKLTVKEQPSLSRDDLKTLIRLYEMAYGINVNKERAKNKTTRKYNLIDDGNMCTFCDETDVLERAHILPFAITKGLDIVGDTKPLDFIHNAFSLCPTHHKKYDTFKLPPNQKKAIKESLRISGYGEYFTALLESIEITKPTKSVDTRLDVAWRWWREYIYGN